ncbi:MAG: radical SAM protein [Desulfobacterota bacterium]|nr:radical SAM protein [Thermodesulfobacteriota bacterium]
MEPLYLRAYANGTLQERIEKAQALLAPCRLCPRQCGVNRLADERGFCATGRYAVVASYGPHFGEEAPLVGRCGSGTIFFSGCNLRCVFCQNYDISHESVGDALPPETLAGIMLELQRKGCHNINFVTPTHVVPQILEALPLAISRGLNIPLVYNTGGYDADTTIGLLDGIVDIYMPDLKFSRDIPALIYCKAPDYPEIVRAAIREMHRQVGDLVLDEHGHAQRGLLVRHLVMPDDIAGTSDAMRFLAGEISRSTYVNIMDQYRPCGDELDRFPELRRRITPEEYQHALEAAHAEGLYRLDDRQRTFLFPWR